MTLSMQIINAISTAENELPNTPQAALAIAKLYEANMWLNQHQAVINKNRARPSFSTNGEPDVQNEEK